MTQGQMSHSDWRLQVNYCKCHIHINTLNAFILFVLNIMVYKQCITIFRHCELFTVLSLTLYCTWAEKWLNCSLCRSQPSALPCVRHPQYLHADKGHWTGHGDTTALAPSALHSHHIWQLSGCSTALCGAQFDHHHHLQSISPLWHILPRKETR